MLPRFPDGAHTSPASTPTEDIEATDRSTHFDATEGDGDPEGQPNGVPDEGGGDVPEPPPGGNGTPEHLDVDCEDDGESGEVVEADTEKSAEPADVGSAGESPSEGEGEPPAGEDGDVDGDGGDGGDDGNGAAEVVPPAEEVEEQHEEEGEVQQPSPPSYPNIGGSEGETDTAAVAAAVEAVETNSAAIAVETDATAAAVETGASAAETDTAAIEAGTAKSEPSEPAELGSPEEALQRLTSVGRFALSDEDDDEDDDDDDNGSLFGSLKSSGAAGEKSLTRLLFEEEPDDVAEVSLFSS